MTIQGYYKNDLRCEMVHLQSDQTIETDAPVDNNGKGENFSPTDLVAAALGSCMLTIIAIRANTKNIEIGTPKFSIEKIMQSSPRKISGIKVKITFNKSLSLGDRDYLEQEARNCPVALSLDENLKQSIEFIYA